MSLENTAHPGRPRADELVPSRYALRVGEIDVLVISDGVFPLPAATLATNADPADLATWLDDNTVLLIVLSPRRADLRLLAIDDADARVCFRWVAVYLPMIPLYPFLTWVIERLGFGTGLARAGAQSKDFQITGAAPDPFMIRLAQM